MLRAPWLRPAGAPSPLKGGGPEVDGDADKAPLWLLSCLFQAYYSTAAHGSWKIRIAQLSVFEHYNVVPSNNGLYYVPYGLNHLKRSEITYTA